MEKPLLEMKRLGQQLHRIVQQRAKQEGIEFMGGPQGRVLHFVGHRADQGQATLIKDVEQELEISKSVASNLIKRMVKNGSIYLEISEKDKRNKHIHLTEQSKESLEKVRDFFDEIDKCLLAGVSKEELASFQQVIEKFVDNMKQLEGEGHV